MNSASAPVLELLALVYPAGLRPSAVHENLAGLLSDPPSRSSIYRAVDDLDDKGFIEKMPGTELYRLTDRGEEWLDGEIRNLEFVEDSL